MLTIILSAVSWVVMQAKKHKEWFAIIGILFLAVVLIAFFRSCRSEPQPKLNEAEIHAADTAIKERNDAELGEILTQSDVRMKQIDANLANAKADTVNAIHESRRKWQNATFEEKLAEYNRRKANQ
jgi:hypothetical protein